MVEPALRDSRLTLTLDACSLEGFIPVAARFGTDRFGFVVTPNIDHMIRLHESSSFRDMYEAAEFILLDSRVAATLFRLRYGVRLDVCPGSDLTEALLEHVVQADDTIVLIGATAAQADALRQRYGLRGLQHVNPPMGFDSSHEQVERVLDFIESHSPFRFCLLAVGSPRQELLASLLAQRGKARGLGLCIGASVDFLTGAERRAPRWMQQCRMEWLFRLGSNPRRLAHRYLVRGPGFLRLLGRQQLRVRTSRLPDRT